MKFKMKQKVWIISSRKTDGRYNRGTIVGVELNYYGLGYLTEAQFIRDHGHARYKVAYIDVFTTRACSEWFSECDLIKEKPE